MRKLVNLLPTNLLTAKRLLSQNEGLPTILPTTKQVVGNGHLQTDLDGKNKKALYLQANNRAFKTFLDG